MGEGSPWYVSPLNALRRRKIDRTRAATITSWLRNGMDEAAADLDRPRYIVRPYRGEGGILAAVPLLEHFHEKRTRFGGLVNASETNAFEIGFDGERTTFGVVPGSATSGRAFRDFVTENAPSSVVSQTHLPAPGFDAGGYDEGRSVAGARLSFFRGLEFPIKHINAGGFANGSTGANRPTRKPRPKNIRDPYKDILDAVTRDEECCVLIQFLFRPIGLGPLRRSVMTIRANTLEQDNRVLMTEWEASDAEEAAATVIRQQINEDLYQVEGRIIATAPTHERASDRVADIGHKYKKYYTSSVDQGVVAHPSGRSRLTSPLGYGHKRRLRNLLQQTIGRRRDKRKGPMECSVSEFAGLAHFPAEAVNAASIQWNRVKPGPPVPLSLPRFPWDDHGIEPEHLSPNEKQAWIMAHADPDSPVFVGTGVRDDVEVGIPIEELEKGAHSLHTGQTRRGKTTVNQEKARQQVSRGKGMLLFDPKGDGEIDQYLRTHPGTPEDTIILTIGENNDPEGYAPRLNFLQLPEGEGVEPGTKAFKQRLEPRISAVEQLVRLGGDTGDGEVSFGARIKGLIRLIARGLADMDETMAPIDLVGVLRSELGRETFIENQDREDLLRDMAESELSALSDREIEPTMRRLQPFALNAIVQPIVSASESSFSIREAVQDGKTILVENRSTDTQAGLMVCTVLLILIWIIKRELEQDHDATDPPGWEIILDEAQEIASEFAGLPQILAQAAGFGVHVTISAQDLTSQLDDDLADRILGETDKIVTFSAGRQGEAKTLATKHSENIGWKEISRLPKYRAYFSVLDEDGIPVSSVQTATFAPLDEVLAGTDSIEPGSDAEQRAKERAAEYGLTYRTSEEVEAFRHESNRIHGAREETIGEIRDRSPFFEGSDGDSDTGDLLTSDTRPAAYKAIYDRQLIHSDDPIDPSPIPFDELADALQTALGPTDETLHDGQIQSVKDSLKREHLAETTRDGRDGVDDDTQDYYYSVEPAGLTFLDQGESPTAGKQHHRDGVNKAYHHLVHWLPECEVSIPDQGGSSDLPDLAIRDPFELSGSALSISKQRSQFEADYPLRAVLTQAADVRVEFEWSTKEKSQSLIKKVTRAYCQDKACLFVVWSAEDARKVHDHLTTPEARQEVPDDALWNIVVLPSTQADFETPQLLVGPSLPRDATADSKPTLIPFNGVSPQAVADATAPTPSLGDESIPEF